MKRGLVVFFKEAIMGMLLGSLVIVLSACGLSGEDGCLEEEARENIQIRTDTEPIYNHFPDLPGTSEMQWCSESSEGIGLNTVRLYLFAYYDHDISGELQGMNVSDQEDAIDLYFVPEGVSGEQKWRIVEDAPFAFQADRKDAQKMNTAVYIDETGTVLYMEAIGD
nr:hypothetical protein [uncultured Acetatifactor sp.]